LITVTPALVAVANSTLNNRLYKRLVPKAIRDLAEEELRNVATPMYGIGQGLSDRNTCFLVVALAHFQNRLSSAEQDFAVIFYPKTPNILVKQSASALDAAARRFFPEEGNDKYNRFVNLTQEQQQKLVEKLLGDGCDGFSIVGALSQILPK
jgi:hypothetical protein